MTFKLPKARPSPKAVTDTHTLSRMARDCVTDLKTPTITPQVLEQMAGDEEAHRQKLDAQNMREHAARVRRQAEAAKQVQDDQRVIADAIRAGQMLSSTVTDQKQPQPAEVWVSAKRLVELLSPACTHISSMIRKITEPENKWLIVCRRQTKGRAYEYGYWRSVSALKNKGKLIDGDPLPPDTVGKARPKMELVNAVSARLALGR